MVRRADNPGTGNERDREALRGVRTFALLLGALNVVGLMVVLLLRILPGAPQTSWMLIVVGGLVALGLPAALYLTVERTQWPADRLLIASAAVFLGVGVVAAFTDIAFLRVGTAVPRPSWICVVMLTYALLVPAPSWQPAILIGISMAYLPLGAIVGYALGLYAEASSEAVGLAALTASVPTWLCGAISLVAVQRTEFQRMRYEKAVRELEKLGSYTLQGKLGEGGMGEVWRARHAFLARPAAVKIIRPEVVGGLNAVDEVERDRAKLALGRLEREAKATAQLTSAHTIRVFDFGRGPNSTFFYVMELLDGLDLHSLVLNYGPQPEARVRHILLQACDSLAEAHDQGMVHRDIKPANLFLCRSGKTLDHVKVLDFGLVRSDPGAKPDDVDTLPRLTRHGIISGSPSFMSPEQAEGADDLDRRADIYALGCVAYFLLTGSEPFSHENPLIVLMHQVNTPPEPMTRRQANLQIDPEFEALVMDMLAKRRNDRPASADEVLVRLRELHLPTVWDQTAAQRWWAQADLPSLCDPEGIATEPSDMRRLVRHFT